MRTDAVGSWNATQMSSMRRDLVEEDAIGEGFDKLDTCSGVTAALDVIKPPQCLLLCRRGDDWCGEECGGGDGDD